ncbi:MAG TPA: SDR family NAD(P)-dependent oxidoreductase [Burkholderiales bacterium]|nr:SDR family NAD(P)-dependent oxidoreductase [Burkholderiales bacterium]
MEFSGKTALVTGGASGIGLATATALAEAGATVYIGDINEQLGRAAAQSLSGKGSVTFLRLDVTDQQSVEAARRAINDERETLDVLINAAGWSKVERFVDTTPELWRRLIDLNYVGVLNVTHAFLPQMIARNRGKIVHVASDAARAGSGGEAVYSGTKGAVVSFTKALARETARYTINVNCVCPGPTDTPLLASIPEKQREALMRAIPFRRFAQPSEVANAILFFASNKADYLTGQVLSVSGGLTMVD